MAKQRYVNTKFWDDSYIVNLDPLEKFLYLYCITNPLTNISGVYEIAIKRIALDTGIDKDMIVKLLNRFTDDNKVYYKDGWIVIRNFIKHQNYKNPKILKAIEDNLSLAPDNLIPYIYPIDSLSHLTKLNLTKLNLIKPNSSEKFEKGLMRGVELEFKEKICTNLLEEWKKNNLPKHKIKTVIDEFKKSHYDIINNFESNYDCLLLDVIGVYSEIVNNPIYYYTHKFSLWDFIKYGYKKFLPEMNPKENFIIDKNNITESDEGRLARLEKRKKEIENL